MKTLLFITALASFSAYSAVTKVKIPAKYLLSASRSLISQTRPNYFAKGKITCQVLSTGWSPTTSSCQITINGSVAKVKKPTGIINTVSKIKVPTGPNYEFSGRFEAYSMSSELPPYIVNENAFIFLE